MDTNLKNRANHTNDFVEVKVDLEKVLIKTRRIFFEFKNSESQLVEKINNLRKEMKKLGMKVPPQLLV